MTRANAHERLVIRSHIASCRLGGGILRSGIIVFTIAIFVGAQRFFPLVISYGVGISIVVDRLQLAFRFDKVFFVITKASIFDASCLTQYATNVD